MANYIINLGELVPTGISTNFTIPEEHLYIFVIEP